MKAACGAVLAAVSVLSLPIAATAATPAKPRSHWSGSGGFGMTRASGNTKSLNVDAKLRLAYENDPWKDTLFLDFNRAKGEVTEVVGGNAVDRYETTANHYDVGGSAAYSLTPRSYVIGTARYDHDDFAPNRWQAVASIGYGYIVFKNARSELTLEAGPGYKRYQPQTYAGPGGKVTPPVQDEVIARGQAHYQLALTDNVSFDETFLAEVGADNKYYQNDIGIAVAMTNKLALKVAYENRYNSNIVPGTKHMDSLFTTNLVYSLGKPNKPKPVTAGSSAKPPSHWSGSGGFGMARTRGNTKSLNVDAKLRLAYQNDPWKDTLFLDFNRAKGEVTEVVGGNAVDRYETTANHYDGGGSAAYSLTPRSYVIGTARYEHDDFAPNRWQAVASIGYGYIVFKNDRSELTLEAGPGYKRYQPQTYVGSGGKVTPPVQDEVIARGQAHYQLALTDNVSFDETFLAEVGADNKYYQNDIGIAVAMTKTLSLKVAYENRYNSNIVPGTKHMDSLFTTNLVYSFGKSK